MNAEQFAEELELQAIERNQVIEEFKQKVWDDFKNRIAEYYDEYGYMIDQESLLHEGFSKIEKEVKDLMIN